MNVVTPTPLQHHDVEDPALDAYRLVKYIKIKIGLPTSNVEANGRCMSFRVRFEELADPRLCAHFFIAEVLNWRSCECHICSC